jgi:tetratricopeptide (TPR) repeat protein
VGKALPKLAAVSLCLLSLTGCVSRGEPGPAFPENYSPNPQGAGSANPGNTPGTAGFPSAAQESGPWAGFVSAVTDNPVTRTFKSAGQKTAETITPKSHDESEFDEVSLNNPPPKMNAAMHVSMAHVHESSNNLDAAAQTYEKALKLDSKHVPAIVGLAQVRFRQQRHDEAYQLFTQTRKLDPHNLQAMLGQAHYQDTKENMPEATRLYTEATQRHPESAAAWNDLGLCLARQGRLPESQQTLQRAVQLDTSNVLYRNNVATVLVELKRNQEALVHLQQAHGQAAGHYNLGFLLHRRGEDQAAAEQFNMALRVDPSFEPARQWLEKLNSEQANPQRADRPNLGRSAALLRGPDGRNFPLFAKNAKRSKGLIAPPEIERLATRKSAAKGADAETVAADDEQSKEAETETMELANSTTEAVDAADAVVPAAAIEISDESERESDSAFESKQNPAPIRRVKVNQAYEAESGGKIEESVSAPSAPAKEEYASPNPLVAKLLQPRIITDAAGADLSGSIPASELPAEISQLQVADDEAFQLETPPAEEANEPAKTAPTEESLEPYFESASDGEESGDDAKPANPFPSRCVSLYDSGEPADAQPASKTTEPARNHGWKKVRVNW